MSINADKLIFFFLAVTFFLIPMGTAPPLITTGCALAVWVFSGKIFMIRTVWKNPWFLPMIPLIILPWVGLLYTSEIPLGLDYALKTKYWVFALVTSSVVLNKNRIDVIIMAFWMGLSLGVVLALLQVTGLMVPFKQDYLGFGIVHTLLSMYLIIGILTASFYFRNKKNLQIRIMLLGMMLLFLFHLSILHGRAGYLIFILLSPLIIQNLMYRLPIIKKVFFCLIMMFSLALSPIVQDEIKNTFIDLKTNKDQIAKGVDITLMPRPFILKSAVKIFIAHPIIGVGTGGYKYHTAIMGSAKNHPHNNILYMAVSFGIFGIFACLWLFWKMFKVAWNEREKPLGYLVLSICMVIFLGGFFDTHILNTGTAVLFTIGYGFLSHLDGKQVTISN
jgi:O-antigen ligase